MVTVTLSLKKTISNNAFTAQTCIGEVVVTNESNMVSYFPMREIKIAVMLTCALMWLDR